MKIQEVMNNTGISKKALQYYEDKHLIHVEKDASGYRNYDEVCVNQLWQIKVLRKMDFSIVEIERIMKGDHRKEIFNNHFNEIDQRMAQCNIQKGYLQTLYNEFEHVSDLVLLKEIDMKMEEDFQRNKKIHVDMHSKRKIPVYKFIFALLCYIIAINAVCLGISLQTALWGGLALFCAIYTTVEMWKQY